MPTGIGGFFPLELPFRKETNSVLALWGVPELPHRLFSNGRSALHFLLRNLQPTTVWLPAYSCISLAEAARDTQARLKFYPLQEEFTPACDFLKLRVKRGDAVVAIDYFGRNPAKPFRELVESLPGIFWIEDRAQAFRPSAGAWGDYVIYSPRKLLGVPDGGILVSRKALPAVDREWSPDTRFIIPSLLRYEDQDQGHNADWYEAHVAYEQGVHLSTQPMSRLSSSILASVDPQPLMKRRQDNYSVLMERLHDVAVISAQDRGFVPLGFPIQVPNRGALASALHREGIFAAHHWPTLASPVSDFPFEHQLCDHLLTLPCDHRYGRKDMVAIAKQVRRLL